MCLILFSYMTDADYPLTVAANRDEFYHRATQPLDFWDDFEGILAGRDLQNNGTWMGVTRSGRFAAITNYRAPSLIKAAAPSRGLLVRDFLAGGKAPKDYLESIRPSAAAFNGFNLLVGCLTGKASSLFYYSNMGGEIRSLSPGTYGLSNAFLDTSWPKVDRGKRAFERIIRRYRDASTDHLLDLMADDTLPDDRDLPDTGVGLAWERMLAPIFIAGDTYGTRSSAVVRFDARGGGTFVERTYRNDASGAGIHDTRTRSFYGNDRP
ncbi:NRDE family protein [Desulfatiferula olefinivorans]